MDNSRTFSSFADEVEQAASLLSAMSNAKRLLVLCYLADAGEAPVARIADEVALSQSALSQHLAKLRADGLVMTRREAQLIFYRLADPRVMRLLKLLRDMFCPELGLSAAKGSDHER